VPIAAVIVILFTPKAKTNAPMFMVGWIAGVLVVGFVVLLIPGLEPTTRDPTTTAGIVNGVLDALLLLAGISSWKKRPGPGETAEAPGWMKGIDTFGIGKSAAMGFLFSGLTTKNVLLIAAAAVAISATDATSSQQAVALLIFALIASSTVIVPVVGYLIAGDRMDNVLASAKTWLIQNNSAVMGVLFLVFGVDLIGEAIQILF
jgi:hypothetical protein